MANSTDPDQLASLEANWSGSILFAKAGYLLVQHDKCQWVNLLLGIVCFCFQEVKMRVHKNDEFDNCIYPKWSAVVQW